jgi:protein-tyrosine phosphatase
MTFTILTVCTGNICRSPLAQLVLTTALAELPHVTIHRAGTAALQGHGMPEPALLLAQAHGLNGGQHVARQIESTQIDDADLILAMSREHRRDIVGLVPTAVRRTFTLRELANLVPSMEPALAATLEGSSGTKQALTRAVALAARLRGTVPPPSRPEDLDIVDPYRRSEATYSRAWEELAPAADRVAALMRRAAQMAS